MFPLSHSTWIILFPSSKGGLTELDNLAFTCGCNDYKRDLTRARDPQTRQLAMLFHPRRQRWADHFAWSENGNRVVGLTPTGRATVEALRMNREELINLRELLISANKHPPTG